MFKLCCGRDDAVSETPTIHTVTLALSVDLPGLSQILNKRPKLCFQQTDSLSIMQTLMLMLEDFLSQKDRAMLTLTCITMRDALTDPETRRLLKNPNGTLSNLLLHISSIDLLAFKWPPVQLPRWQRWSQVQADHVRPICIVFYDFAPFLDDRDAIALVLTCKAMRNTPIDTLDRVNFQRLRWFGNNRDNAIKSSHQSKHQLFAPFEAFF